ncbi:MAG: hypothetical protein Q9221_007950 [Calogaya cf. arnoldii]
MAAFDWPQCPKIEGRPLDTALLPSRDHISELRNCFLDDGRLVPSKVILPFLDNIDTLYDALSRRGPVRDHALDSFRNIQDVGFKIRGCASIVGPAKGRILPSAGSIDQWEDEEEDLDIKDESPSVDEGGSPSVPLVPRSRARRKRDKAFNNRNPRVVTIKVMDPDWQSEVLHLGQARVADMVSSDMVLQGLGPGSFSIRILPSGHSRLMMPTARQAQVLRDR